MCVWECAGSDSCHSCSSEVSGIRWRMDQVTLLWLIFNLLLKLTKLSNSRENTADPPAHIICFYSTIIVTTCTLNKCWRWHMIVYFLFSVMFVLQDKLNKVFTCWEYMTVTFFTYVGEPIGHRFQEIGWKVTAELPKLKWGDFLLKILVIADHRQPNVAPCWPQCLKVVFSVRGGTSRLCCYSRICLQSREAACMWSACYCQQHKMCLRMTFSLLRI